MSGAGSRSFRAVQGVIVFLALISGLTLLRGQEARAQGKPLLVIIPFVIETEHDPSRGAVCPICKEVHRSSEVPPGAPLILTKELYARTETLGVFNVFPLEKLNDYWSPRGSEENLPSSAIQLGKELKADFVMVAVVFRFEERIGSSIGVEKPASVSFELHLFRLRDDKRVWNASFDETQKPLSDDLLQVGSFFKRKAKWLSAAELAYWGMEGAFKKLPAIKDLQERP